MTIKRVILLILFLTVSSNGSAWAGSPFKVTMHGKPLTLGESPLAKGTSLPEMSLPNSLLSPVEMASFKGKVTIVSVVPSIDTAVCEKQTHILSEENDGLDKVARLVTISRDLPFAQRRFAHHAKINNVTFLSDYRDGRFGKATGLMIEENKLLTRALLVLDKNGKIQYLEVVPDLGKLPKMKKAFATARALANQG